MSNLKLIMVSLSLKGFKLLSGQGFYPSDHCDLRPYKPQISKGHHWVMAIHDTKKSLPKVDEIS